MIELRAAPGVGESSGAAAAGLDDRVLQMFAMVSEGLAAATEAFLAEDRGSARALIAGDAAVDSLQSAIEAFINAELAHGEHPADVRRLVAVLLIVLELERSGDLVEHIALRTSQGMAHVLSPRARGLIQEMGDAGVAMWRAAAAAYAAGDGEAAARLRVVDDHLDDLHVSLSTELAESTISVPVAIEMGLVARFLERLGDHAVNVTRRIADLTAECVA